MKTNEAELDGLKLWGVHGSELSLLVRRAMRR